MLIGTICKNKREILEVFKQNSTGPAQFAYCDNQFSFCIVNKKKKNYFASINAA